MNRLAQLVCHLAEAGGATCAEVEMASAMTHQTASARIRELALDGRIVESGNTRPTPPGRKAIVWTVLAQPEE